MQKSMEVKFHHISKGANEEASNKEVGLVSMLCGLSFFPSLDE